MRKEDTLKERLSYLIDLGCVVDKDILTVPFDRKLDLNVTYIKHLTKAGYSRYLESIQTVYANILNHYYE